MCFRIYCDSEFKTEKLKKSSKPVLGWKVIQKINRSLYIKDHGWKNGENISDRVSAKITRTEKYDRSIICGFHFFRTRSGARMEKNFWQRYGDETLKIIRCTIRPEDIVCVNDTEIVATKCWTDLLSQ